MRSSPLSGGCLLRGASRPAVLATFPWIPNRHRLYRGEKLWSAAAAHESRVVGTQSGQALERVLAQLRKAHGIDRLGPNIEAVVSGRGKHLGIAVNWSLRWTAAGSFTEEIRGPQLTFKWGYDGRQDSGCWEVDSSGLVRVMECDDHEAILMTTYLRTGCWLQPSLQDRFDLELLPTPAMAVAAAASNSSSVEGRRGQVGGGRGEEVEADGRAGSREGSSGGSSSGGGGGAGGRKAAATATHRSVGRQASAPGPAADEVVAIGMRVRGRRLRVRVLVRRRDWRLLGFDHRMCADVETWELGEWKEWDEGVWFPSSALHKASNGGQHAYLTSAGAAQRLAPLPDIATAAAAAAAVAAAASGGRPGGGSAAAALPPPTDFGMPLLPPIPGDTSYSLQGGSGQAVPLWRAASGHFLVRPSINGQEGGGYFVLDTGASGFVITPQAAARLGGQSFGETHAASISGKVAARFVRLGSWGLGGVTIRQPVLMVMELEGLVRGAPGEVVGIVGADLFRRAVVEVPQLLGASAAAPRAAAGSSSRTASDPGPGPGSRSGSGSESASEDEGGGTVHWEAASGRREGAVAGAELASGSGRRAGSGGGGSAAASSFGPPPPPPRSTPVFEDACGAAGSANQLISAAATAVPSPSVMFEPPPSPPSSGARAAASDGGSPGTSRSSSSSRHGGSSGRGGNSSRSSIASEADVDAGLRCSDESYSSTSSSRTSGGVSSSSGRSAPSSYGGGRSATARAVRRAARTVPYTLHEMVLHHPLEYDNDSEWVWEPLIMIANLPHVNLRFADPRVGGSPRSALLMVDSGACGADLMLHARAQRELALAAAAAAAGAAGNGGGSGSGGGSSRSQGHYLRGVGTDSKDLVQLQVLDLPWLEMAGVRFEQVRCMCAAVGGLDISIYSHGILCGDLLARLEWAIDYNHSRIGFRRGAAAPALALAPRGSR